MLTIQQQFAKLKRRAVSRAAKRIKSKEVLRNGIRNYGDQTKTRSRSRRRKNNQDNSNSLQQSPEVLQAIVHTEESNP